MTLERPTTTRLGGGGSARATALVITLALVGVVGLAVIGRPPAPQPWPTDQPRAALGPSPTAAGPARALTTPSADRPSPTPPLAAWPPSRPWSAEVRPRSGMFRNQAVVIALGRVRLVTPLKEDASGTLRAIIRLDFPRPALSGTLNLVELSTLDDRANWQAVGSFRLPLDPLVPETRLSGVVVDRSVDPHPERTDAPLLIQVGYSLHVFAESRMDTFALRVTVDPRLDDAMGAGLPGTLTVLGDDGLIGHPGSAD